ncbi:MAG: DUF3108 domain-containing protein [Bacteroidales bacterium]|nr:DUF3108 domain-containing protein [Bacteroidales bacterium]
MKKKIYAKNLGFNILYRRIIPIILLISFSLSVFSQNSSKNKVFQVKSGEIVTYKAYYNWRFIWLKAGSVIFSVSDTLFQNQEAFKFSAKGWSLKEYDWFFKVRDSFETTILKKNQQPLTFFYVIPTKAVIEHIIAIRLTSKIVRYILKVTHQKGHLKRKQKTSTQYV